MSTGAEALVVDGWLYARLSGDAELSTLVGGRIFSALAPPDTPVPFVVYSSQTWRDVRGVGPRARILSESVYQVKAIGEGRSFGPLRRIAERIDELLDGAAGPADGGEVAGVAREEQLAFVEVDEGTEYRHLGGLYRLWTHA